MSVPFEQRNLYQGTPARAWVVLRLAALDGNIVAVKLIADTGNPFAFVALRQSCGLSRGEAKAVQDS
jgi:hypothetical protein